MKKTFRIIVFSAALCAVFGEVRAFAQNAPNNPVKRNSPFSPNPKKKAETVEKIVETAPVSSEIKPVKFENSELLTENENKTEIAPTENSQPAETENRETNFESRSIASKTLEIARRSNNNVNKAPTEIYKIGAGDVLDIRILNSPNKESTLFTVLENGLIDYPLAGEEPLSIVGLTSEEVENLLEEKIKLYENPEVSVNVRDYASHTISVLGLVERAGTKSLRREAIPLYVILAEAIPHSTANKVTILRAADKQTVAVNLEDSETLIYPGDIIRVVSGNSKNSPSQAQFYFIGGEVNSVGQKEFHDGLTLTQAILANGGLKKNSVRKVVIRRKNAEGKLVPTEYDLKFIKDGKIADPVLEAGDTIEIGE